jgi:hypothetical protein
MKDVGTYHIRLRGSLGEAEINAFSPLQMVLVQRGCTGTLFRVEADQAGMIGLMRHLHGLGLVLVSVQREDLRAGAPGFWQRQP